MPFEVADSVDPGDGNRRRDHPRKSLAGEVLKKKLQFNKHVIPPPAIQGSLGPESSLLEKRPEGEEGWDEEEDYYITNNVPNQRSSNTLNTPNRNVSSFVSTSNQTSRTSTTLSEPELITAIEELLGRSPHLKPYIRYRLPLERKAKGNFEFPISPIFYEDSCEICLDHGETCTVDRGESTLKCAACTRFGGRCIFVNLEGTAPRKAETHLNCGRCALGLRLRDYRPPFDWTKQIFSPSEFLELGHKVAVRLSMKELKKKFDKKLLGEGRQWSSTQQGVLMRVIPSSSESYFSEGDMMSEALSLDRSDPEAQNSSSFPARNSTAPILSENSIYKPPSEASLAARSSTIKSSAPGQLVETSALSSNQNLASDSDDRYSEGLVAKWHPSFPQTTTTTSASAYSSESIAESIVNASSQLSEKLLRESLVEPHADNGSDKASERKRRRIEHLNKRRAEYQAKNTLTESNMNRLGSFFTQPRTRLFEPETSQSFPTDNETFQPWLEHRESAEEIPYEAIKPLFPPETTLMQRQLELIKTTEKVYIPGERHTPDIRDARKQLRYGFMEAQGGELLVRHETIDSDGDDDDEKVDEELTTEQYWKRRVKAKHNSFQGSFWEHEPRRHR